MAMTSQTTQRPARSGLWPHAVTPACCVAALPVTAGANHVWGGNAWASAAVMLGGVVIVLHTWRASRARGPLVQWVACGTAGLAVAWVVAAVIVGPFSRPLIDVWVWGMAVFSIVMSVQRGLRNGPSESTDSPGDLASAVTALKGVKFAKPKWQGAKLVQPVVMPAGTPFSDLEKPQARSALASALDVRETAIRLVPNPDSARRGEIHVVPQDLLRDKIPWPGPSAPGQSIAQPLVLGHMEDGEPLRLWLPGDPAVPRNATHVAMVGMTGAGKTRLVELLAGEILTRHDVEVWLIDRRKGEQLPQWLLDGAARVALDDAAADRMLADLRSEVSARAGILGRAGYQQWLHGAPIPYRVVIIDEAAGLIRSAAFVELAETCRSVGITLLVGLQRATHDRVSTSARSNFGCWLVMGCKDAADVDKALAEETKAAGAAPWKWQADKPGYLYAQVPGVPRDRWAVPARTYDAQPEDLDGAVTAVRDALGLRAPAPPPPVDVDVPAQRRVFAMPSTPQPPVQVPVSPARGGMSPSQARGVLVQHLTDLVAAGHETVRPADLSKVLETVDRSAPWLSAQLKDLCGGPDPMLAATGDRGVYRLLTSARSAA